MTETELKKAQAAFERASARAEDARVHRDELVAQALAAGWTHATIARVTGLTRGRVGQMAMRQQPRPNSVGHGVNNP